MYVSNSQYVFGNYALWTSCGDTTCYVHDTGTYAVGPLWYLSGAAACVWPLTSSCRSWHCACPQRPCARGRAESAHHSSRHPSKRKNGNFMPMPYMSRGRGLHSAGPYWSFKLRNQRQAIEADSGNGHVHLRVSFVGRLPFPCFPNHG